MWICVCCRVKCSLVYLNNCHFSGIFIFQLNTSERQDSMLIRIEERMLESFPSSLRDVVCLISIWLIRYADLLYLYFRSFSLEKASAHSSLNHVSSAGRDILVLVHIITNIFSALLPVLPMRMDLHLCVVFGKRQTHVMKVFCQQIYFTWERLIKYVGIISRTHAAVGSLKKV